MITKSSAICNIWRPSSSSPVIHRSRWSPSHNHTCCASLFTRTPLQDYGIFDTRPVLVFYCHSLPFCLRHDLDLKPPCLLQSHFTRTTLSLYTHFCLSQLQVSQLFPIPSQFITSNPQAFLLSSLLCFVLRLLVCVHLNSLLSLPSFPSLNISYNAISIAEPSRYGR